MREIATAILTGTNPDQVLGLVARHARELVGADFATLGLQGSAMLARDPDLQRRIGDAVEELDRVIGDLRNYIFGLRPGILADRQLDHALRRW